MRRAVVTASSLTSGLTFVAVVGERATMAVVGVVLIVALVCAGS